MKRIMILLLCLFFLWACSDIETDVYIQSKKVESIEEQNNVYVQLEALEALNIDILRDLQKKNIYITDSTYPEHVSNDRPYNWYIDQGDTGLHSGSNCGPSSVVMAALWTDEDFKSTPEQARELYRPEGGWWYTSDVEKYFDKYNISYIKDDYDDYTEIVDALIEGYIVLLCIDTTFIEEIDEDNSYIGKFYPYDGGHFVIVKGYTYLDGQLYFEMYDSNCWGETYDDGSPKGKDRLYSEESVTKAIESWWDHYFIIEDE